MDISIETKEITPVPAQPLGEDLDALMRTFEAFKEANDTRLAEIESRKDASALTEEKLFHIEESLDNIQHRVSMLQSTEGVQAEQDASVADRLSSAHKSAFEAYVRKGDLAQLQELERKAMSIGSEVDGGYLVPAVTEMRIMKTLGEESPIRSISDHIAISGSVYKRLFRTNGSASGWVGETDPRSQTATPVLAELSFPVMELYAMPAATLTLLDDAAVDLEDWITKEVGEAFALQEGRAFITGDGVNQPKGFLGYDAVPESEWSWGNVGYIATGADGAFAASTPADALINLVYSLETPYRRNARFVMNRLSQAAVRRLKTENGDYLWQPSLSANLTPTLLGFPVTDCDGMPDIAENSLSMAFGDFTRGYLVVDRKEINVLRDPYSAKPYVLFYCTKRVGGGVQDFNAIKLLKFAAD